MQKPLKIAFLLFCAWGCADSEHAQGPAVTYPTDTGGSDADADTDQDGTNTGGTDAGSNEPEITDAEIVHPAPILSECVRFIFFSGRGRFAHRVELQGRRHSNVSGSVRLENQKGFLPRRGEILGPVMGVVTALNLSVPDPYFS
jgi:hypothetical protein